MVQFSKLKLSGFKSFADNTELEIMPGLTGIVGPNGCGKSNLTEALRWLMGETSAKSLRGGEMDDVIFAGSGKRSSRNFAEVTLTLGNPNQTAPEPYAKLDTIEISRRIDRGMGSDYRINGKIVRASDVQLFFADSATGAHSPSIVSQGRVSDLISAKPVDRRRVLEDAAAISGLHNRRKEAETRLRAAEKNLTRVDDLLGQKSGLYEQLVKQAKQAERYRTLSDTIRRLEALSMAMEWQRVHEDIEAAQASMMVANEAQNQAKQGMYDLSKQREALQSHWDTTERQLQSLQDNIQTLQRQKDRAEEELRRYTQSLADLQQQQQSAQHDHEYETEAQNTAQEKITALTAEHAELEQKLQNFSSDVETARNAANSAKDAHSEAQQQLSAARAQMATLTAQRHMLHQQSQRLHTEQQNLQNEQTRVQQVLAQLATDLQAADLDSVRNRVQQDEQTLQSVHDQTAQHEANAQDSQRNTQAAYETLQTTQSALRAIDTEIKALAALAEADHAKHDHAFALDQVTVDSGYEQALTVALGRELRAGLTGDAPMFWQQPSDIVLPDLPNGSVSLYSVVKAPNALHLALNAIGVVENKAAGEALVGKLQPGQMLVSRDGYGWRWDGYNVTPQAQNSAQERETKQLLEQRNRLAVLRDERVAAEENFTAADTAHKELQATHATLQQAISQSRAQANDVQRSLSQTRAQLLQSERAQADLQARQQALGDKQQDLAARLQSNSEHTASLQQQIDALPPEADSQNALQALQETAQTAEQTYRSAEQHFHGLNTQQTQWQSRLHVVTQEQKEWQSRAEQSAMRVANLNERLEKITTALGELKSPDHVEEQLQESNRRIATIEQERSDVQTRRSELNAQRQGFDKQNQEYQEALMGARETLVRAETTFHNSQQTLEQLQERCLMNLECAPNEVAEQFKLTDEDLGQNMQIIRGKQDRARAERERIGAVNLRAEEESQVLGEEMTTLTTEKEDVVAAIEKLRHGISTLNRDARKKMLAAFEEVNTRFKDVFTRLFNGGEAHLQLIDADDPLEAGLEIFASPPGKRLQTLTLLSGGEQSLTAIALIFAMFLTNPSPICILDEIDAALDDANVERICNLLKDFSKTHPTRFLVITHNNVTMNYMHRLYGVTMIEKGISKLVSVDLENQQQAALPMAAE